MSEESGSWYCLSTTGWLVTGVVTLVGFYIWRKCRIYNTFTDLGIKGPKPWPLLGNTITLFKPSLSECFTVLRRQYGNVFGVYFNAMPALVIGDLDMLKEVMVKQFHVFPNRRDNSDSGLTEKPWKYVLTSLRDDHWKHVRTSLSPTFSSGKLKKLMPTVERVTDNLKDFLKQKAEKGEAVEIKEICNRFSMDIIAGAAFGFDVNSIENPEDPFVKRAYSIMNPGAVFSFFMFMFPKLLPYLRKLGVMDAFKATNYLMNVTEGAFNDCRVSTDGQAHSDFLHLLVESQQKEGVNEGPVDAEINHGSQMKTSGQWTRKGLSKDEITANVMVFLLAGYETVSTVMSFTLFCLANNPECLKKAQEEVDEKLEQGSLNYSQLANELPYLEMCINEAMRLYPPGFIVDRQASCDTEIQGVKIKKDMVVWIPVKAIHNDPDLWPEPETFDPMRHTPEAKAERHPFAFMPFGMGPRNCIGMRLAQLEVRLALATVLRNFTPVPCEKTVYPPKMMAVKLQAKDGLWVMLKSRSEGL